MCVCLLRLLNKYRNAICPQHCWGGNILLPFLYCRNHTLYNVIQ